MYLFNQVSFQPAARLKMIGTFQVGIINFVTLLAIEVMVTVAMQFETGFTAGNRDSVDQAGRSESTQRVIDGRPGDGGYEGGYVAVNLVGSRMAVCGTEISQDRHSLVGGFDAFFSQGYFYLFHICIHSKYKLFFFRAAHKDFFSIEFRRKDRSCEKSHRMDSRTTIYIFCGRREDKQEESNMTDKRSASSNRIVGIFLVLIGMLVLLVQSNQFQWQYFWPLILVLGGVLFALGFFVWRENYGLLMPAAILIILGLFFFYMMRTQWFLIDRLWPVFILAPGIGFLLMYFFGPRHNPLWIPGMILILLALIFFAQFCLYFRFWPLILIIIGLYLIFQRSADGDKSITAPQSEASHGEQSEEREE